MATIQSRPGAASARRGSIAGAGNDTVLAMAGTDVVFGGPGNDSIDGGDGNDSLYADSGNDTLLGGNGDDILSSSATWADNDGDDVYRGGPGIDSLAYLRTDHLKNKPGHKANNGAA